MLVVTWASSADIWKTAEEEIESCYYVNKMVVTNCNTDYVYGKNILC